MLKDGETIPDALGHHISITEYRPIKYGYTNEQEIAITKNDLDMIIDGLYAKFESHGFIDACASELVKALEEFREALHNECE